MVFGYRVETTQYDSELDKQLDNLRFVCISANGFDSVKYEYYKEQLLEQYSSHNNFGEEVEQVTTEQKLDYEPQEQSTLSVGPMDSAWPMQSHDIHHTGRSPYSTADNPYVEKWRFWEDRWLECGSVIDTDGIIYIGDAWGDLSAIYPNGTVKWKYTLGGQIMGSTPAIVEDGTIYVGAWDDYLYAVNPDGTRKWRFLAHADISSSPVISEDGTIYFGTMLPYNTVWAVNPNGTEKWRYQTGDAITSDPAIGDDGTIYIGSCDGYLYALWPSGTLRWRFKTGDEIHSHPSIAKDGTIYISSFDGYLYALYPNGTLRWKYGGGGDEASPAIDKDGSIYVGNDKLRAIYPNGTEKWSINVAGGNIDHASPAISDDGIVYVGAGCYIVAVTPDGNERWHKKIAKEWIKSSPSIGEDGTVYIGTTEGVGKGGYLYAFGPQETNDPPTAPSITGPTTGKAGTSYDYKFVASDPDRNPVSYYVEWGDGTSTGWTDDYNTGEEITLSHAWSSDGTFTIKAKARDTFGAEGPEASLTVTMPRSREVQQMLFHRLLEHFPITQKILLYLIK
jgi:outer membrane protein assembly factor BamB